MTPTDPADLITDQFRAWFLAEGLTVDEPLVWPAVKATDTGGRSAGLLVSESELMVWLDAEFRAAGHLSLDAELAKPDSIDRAERLFRELFRIGPPPW